MVVKTFKNAVKFCSASVSSIITRGQYVQVNCVVQFEVLI